LSTPPASYLFFEQKYHYIAQDGLNSCLNLPSAEITGVNYHARLTLQFITEK
jgi:hypothetical protein